MTLCCNELNKSQKSRHLYTATYMERYQERFTIQSSVLKEQVAAAHCPNERTLDPQCAAVTDPPVPQPAAQWPSPCNVFWQQLNIFSSEYYQILIATHLPTKEGWKAELA